MSDTEHCAHGPCSDLWIFKAFFKKLILLMKFCSETPGDGVFFTLPSRETITALAVHHPSGCYSTAFLMTFPYCRRDRPPMGKQLQFHPFHLQCGACEFSMSNC